MKKTLIALAAVASFGTSFAQVAITGGVDFTFGKTTAATDGSVSKGLAATDAYIDVGVTEDLGGGMKAVASMEFNSDGSWGANNYSGDKSVVLSGASGTLGVFNTRSSSILNNIMFAPEVSSTDHWTASANSGVMARGGVDALVVMLPAMSGVTLGYKYVEGGDGYGTPTSVTHVLYGKYAVGALTSVLEYNIRPSDYITGDARSQRLDLTATYDAGVAKFAVGYESGGLNTLNSTSAGTAAGAIFLSAVAPVGSNSVGLNYGKRDAASFTEVAAQYNLSKLTYVAASLGSFVSQAGVSTDTYGIRLGKNF